MRHVLKSLFATSALLLVAGAAQAGQPEDRNPDSPGLGWAKGHSNAAPGPEAGIGIPVLLTVGGYIWLSRRARRKAA